MEKGHRSRIFRAILWGMALAGVLSRTAGAVVRSAPETAGGTDAVYVAGNPDWYPIEYYDTGERCYTGVLPQLLERISEQTGLNFTYVQAGKEDQRPLLAQSGQAAMISGIVKGDPELAGLGLTFSGTVLTIPEEEGPVQVCFAFTESAGEELIAAVESALGEVSQQETAGLVLQFMMEHPEKAYPEWLSAAAAAAVLLLLAVIAVMALRLRRCRSAAGRDTETDLVTGIGNKAYFTRRFGQIPDRDRGRYCTAFIGFDIMRVNQYYGEAEAEDQLRFAANELMRSAADSEITARVSGGGFAVARPSASEQDTRAWAAELLGRLNRYTEKYGRGYRPEFRMGVYQLQPSDRSCEAVLFNARQGYQQAVSGDLSCVFSRVDALKRENEALQLKRQIQDALQNQEFRMFLQFIVRGDGGAIAGAEALSRWVHPQKGLLCPDSYIGLMELENTISKLDFYIFEEACKQLERWHRQGRYLSISCNFARTTIDREDFVPQLQRIADQYDFRHASLVIEITEDAMENNKEAAFANASKCKEMGFRIALDDAGSGYTSFSDLRDYPIDIVKIDRSLLNAAVGQRDDALLKGMIALAHSMGMTVLCEGVETEDQAELLRCLGCDYMQGYYYYRALPQEEADRVLNGKAKAGAEISVSE